MRLRESFGCGCAAFDYDNDGLQDVLLVADPHPVLYRNAGGGNFENVTASSGLMLAARADSLAAGGSTSRGSADAPPARRRPSGPAWPSAIMTATAGSTCC